MTRQDPIPGATSGGGPVDPEIAATLHYPWRPSRREDITPFREGLLAALADAPAVENVARSTHVVDGGPGRADVRVHVLRPSGDDGELPALVWIHGGGYVRGVAAMDDARFADWCPRLRCAAVTIDYRLAPETPYPGPLEDCAAALRWTQIHAEELGIDARRIGVGGASAGGGLAAAVALRARDAGDRPPAFQCLVYPMLDDRMVTPSSTWRHVPVWPPESNRLGWSCYLGELEGTYDVSPHAAPARATDLGGLPTALVACGSVDVVVDEGVEYAARLNRAGVPADLRVHGGLPHGADLLVPLADLSQRFRHDVEEWLLRHLHPRGSP